MSPGAVTYSFHLPKCAGGTIAVSASKTPGFRLMTHVEYTSDEALEPNGYRLWVDGHTSFGLHHLHGREAAYVTVLRDPVDRLISEFFFLHAHAEFFIPENERLAAFIEAMRPQPHLNYYCHMFSSYCFDKQAAIAEGGGPLDLLKTRQRQKDFLALRTDFARVDIATSYRQAHRNLVEQFAFVGDYHRFGDLLDCIERRYGFAIDRGARVHATPARPELDAIPADVRAELIAKTEGDRALLASVAMNKLR